VSIKLRAEGRVFRADRSIFIARAPGRLDLMGGNVDYTGGMVFESTLCEATWGAVQLRDDDSIVLINPQMRECEWEDHVTFPIAALTGEEAVRQLVNSDPRIRWTAYVLGTFYWLKRQQAISGATVYIASDLPMNKGVSSSAAVEVAVMKAASVAYGRPVQGIPGRRHPSSIHLENSRVNMREIYTAPQGPSLPMCSSVSFAGGTPHSCCSGTNRKQRGETISEAGSHP
jgi:galactokinase-like galactose-binding protein/GHMP kinase-like protein